MRAGGLGGVVLAHRLSLRLSTARVAADYSFAWVARVPRDRRDTVQRVHIGIL